jgi:hypothetical protein
MQLKITLDLNNDAFSRQPLTAAAAVIADGIRALKNHGKQEDRTIRLRDINGNTVGLLDFEA